MVVQGTQENMLQLLEALIDHYSAHHNTEKLHDGIAAAMAAGTVFVALDAQALPVGFVWFEVQDERQNWRYLTERVVYVSELFVLPRARGQGVGRRLMRNVEMAAKFKKVAYISLHAADSNAAEFYKALGYFDNSQLMKVLQ